MPVLSSERPSEDPPDGAPRQGVHVPEAPVGSALLRLLRAHAQLGIHLLGRIGLAPPQELILLYLEGHESRPQGEIVRLLFRDRSTVSKTLKAMEHAGLITRRAAPGDRRALDVSITDAGRALCPAVRDAWTELEAVAFAHLSAADRANLMDAMSSARDALKTSLDERTRDRRAAGRNRPS